MQKQLNMRMIQRKALNINNNIKNLRSSEADGTG